MRKQICLLLFIFNFFISKYGIIPWGGESSGSSRRYLTLYCNIANTATDKENGVSCGAWIMKYGNMDYLHKTVKWDGLDK